MYQKSKKKKDKIGNTILSLAQGVNKRNNHHIFIILQYYVLPIVQAFVFYFLLPKRKPLFF
ncbi:hypothetical protein BK732_28045 [Bacillus thuringiensis serovar navarrensis]|uniref:Uncharacterized protein n=1 Tax=Bacillus thuringiensis serovar navarrensis TaxID=339658 RepID=A0A243A267_BACTU|nr:hypothetical protein BK732_28045 [Bacillus thuringiensis serovar navarrensis]